VSFTRVDDLLGAWRLESIVEVFDHYRCAEGGRGGMDQTDLTHRSAIKPHVLYLMTHETVTENPAGSGFGVESDTHQNARTAGSLMRRSVPLLV